MLTGKRNTSNMEQSKTKIVLIREENLRPFFDKYFKRISEIQWQLLSVGTIDVETQAVLSDMIADIIQTISADILKIFIPLFLKQLTENKDQTASPENFVTVELGDAFCKSLARALNVAEDNYEGVNELTELAKEEIEEKVNSLLSAITESDVLPPEPFVYVSGFTSNVKRLGHMVFLAVRCLRACIGKLNATCLKKHVEDKASIQVPDSIKSTISIASATESIKDILNKWSPSIRRVCSREESKVESENVSSSLSSSYIDAETTAADILSAIIENMPSPASSAIQAETNVLHKPRKPLTLIADKVKNLFVKGSTKKKVTDTEGIETPKKCRFSKFVNQRFHRMMEELKGLQKRGGKKFFLKIACNPKPVIPPEKLGIKSEITFVNVVKKEQITLDKIKFDVENFISKITQSVKSAEELRKKFMNIKDCSDVQTFSRELVNNIYGHLMTGELYELPFVPPGKSFSDSVIPNSLKGKNESQTGLCPEALYVMTEDAVGKFVQQILLCMVNELNELIVQSEDISGALGDITKFLNEIINSHDDRDAVSKSTEDIEMPTTSLSPSGSVSHHTEPFEPSVDHADDGSLKDETVRDEKSVSESKVTPDTSSKETTSGFLSDTESSPETSSCSDIQDVSPEAPEPVEKCLSNFLTNSLVSALLLRLLKKFKHECGKRLLSSQFDTMIERLSHIILVEVDNDKDNLMVMEDNLQDIAEVLVRYLLTKFGTRERLLLAVINSDSRFEDTILHCLRVELRVRKETKKKGRIARFFSAVGNFFDKAVMAMLRKP